MLSGDDFIVVGRFKNLRFIVDSPSATHKHLRFSLHFHIYIKYTLICRGGLAPQILMGFFSRGPQNNLQRNKMLTRNIKGNQRR
jgi:hypothetical protein